MLLSDLISRVVIGSAYAGGIVLLWFSANSYATNKRLANIIRELNPRVDRPMTWAGLRFPLNTVAEVTEMKAWPTQSTPRRRLILVHSDRCAACEKQMPFWQRLLEDKRVESFEVLLMTIDTHKKTTGLSAILRRQGRPYQVLTVHSVPVMSMLTGITALPVTMIATVHGQDTIVDRVQSGVFDDKTTELLLNSTPSAPSRTFMFGVAVSEIQRR